MEAPSAAARFRPLDRIVPAARIALVACAAIHLYGASFYFSNAGDLDAMEAARPDWVPRATPDATVITYENVTTVVCAVLLLLFYRLAYANARLGAAQVPAVSHLVWIYMLLSYAPKRAGRSMLTDPGSFDELRVANALECGGEAMAAIAAICAIVTVTLIGIRQGGRPLSRPEPAPRPEPAGSGRSPLASRT